MHDASLLQVTLYRVAVYAGLTLDAPQRPAEPSQRTHLFLFLGSQDVGHSRVATSWPTRRQRPLPDSQLAGFQVFPTGGFWVFSEAPVRRHAPASRRWRD